MEDSGEEEKEVFFRSINCYLLKAGLKCLHDVVQERIKMGEGLRLLKVYRIISY